ncbi:ankyrin repeat domain-containing protein [Methylomonas montana]|uniref:ankyrin repeat domain-containing protein n=1 Tax=Methylomonas montana TaxID=3058963 RepID=UPI002657AF58|nr:ankyrin repeat domain-containing protein [Methylomonas montana]WKJ88821.1 ankyrin repeat domain-containing protein [Methylomonas montana]
MWDVFISHASEDKDEIARPLADALVGAGLRVWYDEFALKLGDSLSGTIDHGLAQTRYGIVILSPAFFAKEWPKRELDGLNSREISAGKVILPVWHKVSRVEVERFSPILADKLSVSSDQGLAAVVHDILQVFHEGPTPAQAKTGAGRIKKRTLVIATISCLMLATAAWFYTEVAGPAYARARLDAWPLEYSANNFVIRADQGDLAAVKLFLAAGIDPNLPASLQGGITALEVAAFKGRTDVMEALIKCGAKVNKWVGGNHALMSAANGGQLAAVQLLLANGAEADAIDKAIHSATIGGNPEVMRTLFEHGAKLSADEGVGALHDAAFRGHTAVIGLLLDHGVDVNGKENDGSGFSALVYAVRDDHIPTAKLLLERGADINIRDNDGQTPLMWVLTHEETARFLIDKGADIHAKDKQGVSVLAHAVSQVPYGSEPIVDLLLASGADPNLPADNGGTPLMAALSSSKSVDVVEKLLEKGVEVNAKDQHGYTPLMYALKYQDFSRSARHKEPLADVVRALLRRGARVGDKADDGENALSLAKQLPAEDRKRIVKLMQSGAKA